MKMKSRITMGLGLVFFLVFIIAGLSIYYLNRNSNESKSILKDNYRSLEYVEKMTRSLNEIRSAQLDMILSSPVPIQEKRAEYQKALVNFDTDLRTEEANITEPGEKQLAASLRRDLNGLVVSDKLLQSRKGGNKVSTADFRPIWSRMDVALGKIHNLNMKAIYYKNERAQVSSTRTIAIMTVFTAICLVLADLYYFYFPGYVAYGLTSLSERIKELAAGNYAQKENIETGDEFQEISESFDKLVEQLREKEKNV